MRQAPITLFAAGNMATTLTSAGIYLANVYAYSVQCTWSGGTSPAGTFKLQGSNDPGEAGTTTTGATQPTHWTDIGSSSQMVSATPGSVLYDVPQCGYRWFRLVYTADSGSATLLAIANLKGP